MAKQHRFIAHQPITLAHGDVVEKQAALGPTTLLVKNQWALQGDWCLYLRKLRLTILVIDCTLYPSRVLDCTSNMILDSDWTLYPVLVRSSERGWVDRPRTGSVWGQLWFHGFHPSSTTPFKHHPDFDLQEPSVTGGQGSGEPLIPFLVVISITDSFRLFGVLFCNLCAAILPHFLRSSKGIRCAWAVTILHRFCPCWWQTENFPTMFLGNVFFIPLTWGMFQVSPKDEWGRVWLNLGLALTCGGHRQIEFNRSRALLGSIASIERSRVSDLQNPDEERPLAAHWRVFQFKLACVLNLEYFRVLPFFVL